MQKNRHIPVRTCVSCRRKMPKSGLARYTCPAGPGQALEPDPEGKRPGRGFYLCPDPDCARKFHKFKGWVRKCKGETNDR